jgi:hypothetical protein
LNSFLFIAEDGILDIYDSFIVLSHDLSVRQLFDLLDNVVEVDFDIAVHLQKFIVLVS